MMRFFESRILWGGILIFAGILFLAQNMGLIQVGDLFWMVIFALAGMFFLALFVQNRVNWWAWIPGITLLSLALLVFLNWTMPDFGSAWGGSIILGGIGMGFFLVYLFERQNWWALIPAGVLLTLATVAWLDKSQSGFATAGIFFLGLGLTFALVALLPTPQGEMRWAWIPSIILLLGGGLFLVAREGVLTYLWPAALILVGGFLVLRSFRR